MLMFTESSIRYHHAHPGRIDERLHELDEEWDVERVLETHVCFLTLGGMVLSLFHKRFLLLSTAGLALLVQHARQGWCPPLPLLRRLGFRTRMEIEYERYALKLLRGDYVGSREEGRLMVEQILDLSLGGPDSWKLPWAMRRTPS
jgi:hypothetical protein